ncbi:MAG TPA: hypothetical protein VES40_07035 [Ilumatobacteraceae bacterium]|nr:hypothetical protein [Ilumatobacteraceae bacterium]
MVAGLAVLGLAVTACGGSDESASESTTEFTLLPTTTPPATTSTTSTTSTTTSTTTSSTSTTSTIVQSSTTVVDPAVLALVLSGDGIGTAGFGAEPDGVISYLNSYLGEPTNDTDWVDPLTIGICSGTELRRVSWGVLTLLFGDVSSVVQGRRHFFGYTYGDQAEIGASPVGLATSRGVMIGSRVVDVTAGYPAVQIFPEDDFTPPVFAVNDSLGGFLTGVDDDATVTAIIGGDDCGI